MMLRKSFHFLAAGILVLLAAGGTQSEVPAVAKPSATGSRSINTGRIVATFKGIQGHDGYLRVSLFNVKSFPDGVPLARRDISLQTLSPQALVDPIRVSFTGLQPGVYAVCVFHDRNGSGKMTQNFLGIPQEEWGMSRNPHPQFRAPRFDEAKIGLNPREAKTITIKLKT